MIFDFIFGENVVTYVYCIVGMNMYKLQTRTASLTPSTANAPEAQRRPRRRPQNRNPKSTG